MQNASLMKMCLNDNIVGGIDALKISIKSNQILNNKMIIVQTALGKNWRITSMNLLKRLQPPGDVIDEKSNSKSRWFSNSIQTGRVLFSFKGCLKNNRTQSNCTSTVKILRNQTVCTNYR